MASEFGKAVVIANPRAGKGWVGRDGGDGLRELLKGVDLEFDLHLTTAAGHATSMARQALQDGHRFLVAVGGDGTIHEVVNGLLEESQGAPADAVLGVISAGSGADFIRTFGLPDEPQHAVKHLQGENLFPIDVGRVTCTTNGNRRTEYFPNIAEAGLGAEVVRRAERLPRFLGRGRYLLGFWMTLGFYKPAEGKVLLDDRTYEGTITNLVVANGQFFGGGMRIAPKAHPSDGKFDVLIQKGTKIDYVSGITKVYKGDHVPSPAIKQYLASRVEVTTETPLQVEADGELLGFTPATFEILPEVLRLKI